MLTRHIGEDSGGAATGVLESHCLLARRVSNAKAARTFRGGLPSSCVSIFYACRQGLARPTSVSAIVLVTLRSTCSLNHRGKRSTIGGVAYTAGGVGRLWSAFW